jgi:hypothetical protein
MSQQEKNASESFLAGIEELVNQILFVPDIPCQQICHEHIGERRFAVNHIHHGFLIASHHRASGHRGCGAHAAGLSCEATLPEEITLVQNAYCGSLPVLSHNDEFYFALTVYKKQHPPSRPEQKIIRLSEKVAIVRPPSMVERKVGDRRCAVSWSQPRVS